MSALDANQGRYALVRATAGLQDVFDGVGHHQIPGMLLSGLVDRIDHVKRAPRVVVLVNSRIDPDGKELSSEIPDSGFGKVPMRVSRVSGGIKGVIDKAVGRIGMSVNHDGRIVDLGGVGLMGSHFGTLGGASGFGNWLGGCGNGKQ